MVRGVPEQAVVVRGLVLIRVVDVDIDHMASEVLQPCQPSQVSASEELTRETCNRVVLIVVVRHEGGRPLTLRVLVVGVKITKVTPPILVDSLSLVIECIVTLNRSADERQVIAVQIFT